MIDYPVVVCKTKPPLHQNVSETSGGRFSGMSGLSSAPVHWDRNRDGLRLRVAGVQTFYNLFHALPQAFQDALQRLLKTLA
jgi:hypothetical protein